MQSLTPELIFRDNAGQTPKNFNQTRLLKSPQRPQVLPEASIFRIVLSRDTEGNLNGFYMSTGMYNVREYVEGDESLSFYCSSEFQYMTSGNVPTCGLIKACLACVGQDEPHTLLRLRHYLLNVIGFASQV